MSRSAEHPAIPDLAGHVRLRLEQWLGSPEWQHGGRLPAEAALAEKFSVSRPTLRKALQELREQGRIVSRRGSGNFVQPMATLIPDTGAELTIRTVFDMKRCLAFRTSMECSAAEMAAAESDPAALTALKKANEALALVKPGQSIFEADFAFHVAVAHASLNPYFPFVLQTIKDQIRLTIEFTRQLGQRPMDVVEPRVLEEHGRIVAAIESGNPDAAHDAMKQHMRQTNIRLLGK